MTAGSCNPHLISFNEFVDGLLANSSYRLVSKLLGGWEAFAEQNWALLQQRHNADSAKNRNFARASVLV